MHLAMPFIQPQWPSPRAGRVLVVAPTDGDADAITQVLRQTGVLTDSFLSMHDVADEIARDGYAGCAAVIVSQEAIAAPESDGHRALLSALAAQPPWSDLPLILLAVPALGEEGAWRIARALDPIGNITILERPLRRTTLINAVAVALRSRSRQYDLRATLDELDRHRRHLSELVEEQTGRLAKSAASLNAAERLASLGTLAAGLGHDIANLTFPIRARLDALRCRTADPDCLADLDAVSVALAHLARLSAGMRLMSMDPQREASSAATDLAIWIGETEAMFRAALPRHVALECKIPDGLGVAIARHRLAQAVFNLVQNAGEAMAAQPTGLVRISAEPAADTAGAPLVVIRVEDNGPGMAPDVLARCFEPYFSTKGRAIATGMGLGMVRGIIEAADGAITVHSTLNGGTHFTITLPAAAPRKPDLHDHSPALAAAITIRDARIAGFVRLCLERLRMHGATHESEDLPAAPVWILDAENAHRIAEFLAAAPHNHAVLLDGESGSTRAGRLPRGLGERLTVLASPPTSSDLIMALDRAEAPAA